MYEKSSPPGRNCEPLCSPSIYLSTSWILTDYDVNPSSVTDLSVSPCLSWDCFASVRHTYLISLGRMGLEARRKRWQGRTRREEYRYMSVCIRVDKEVNSTPFGT